MPVLVPVLVVGTRSISFGDSSADGGAGMFDTSVNEAPSRGSVTAAARKRSTDGWLPPEVRTTIDRHAAGTLQLRR